MRTQNTNRPIRCPLQRHVIQNIVSARPRARRVNTNLFRPQLSGQLVNPISVRNVVRVPPRIHAPNATRTVLVNNRLILPHARNIHAQNNRLITKHLNSGVIRLIQSTHREKRVIASVRELTQNLRLPPSRALAPSTPLLINPRGRRHTRRKHSLLPVILLIHTLTRKRRQIVSRNRKQRPVRRILNIVIQTIKLSPPTFIRVTNPNNTRILTRSNSLHSCKNIRMNRTRLIQKNRRTRPTTPLERPNSIPVRRLQTPNHQLLTIRAMKVPLQRLINAPRQSTPITHRKTIVRFQIRKNSILNLTQRRSR